MYEDTKSVDKILWCDHSNETSLSALLLGPVCLFVFKKFKKERDKFYLGIKLTIKDC